MNTDTILKTIFKRHDEYSHESVFTGDYADRLRAFDKAEAIRELLSDIRDKCTVGEELSTFNDAIMAHTNAIAKGIFYNRNLNFEKQRIKH